MTFVPVAGSVQSLVPSTRPMKLAEARGASFSKSLQVMRPLLVSMTAVGPVGTREGDAVDRVTEGFNLGFENAFVVPLWPGARLAVDTSRAPQRKKAD